LLITNAPGTSPSMESVLANELHAADEVWLVAGYVSPEGAERLGLRSIGPLKPIHLGIGLALAEGLPGYTLGYLMALATALRRGGGDVVACSPPAHGKIYVFRRKMHIVAFVGSSNLTANGMADWVECNVRLEQPLADLVLGEARRLIATGIPIEHADISVRPPRIGRRLGRTDALDTAEEELGSSGRAAAVLHISFLNSEGRVPERSGLNWWNGGGRPRSPDEAYIPLRSSVLPVARSFFPNQAKTGTRFEAVTDDGQRMTMLLEGSQTGGYAKQISSLGDKTVFGRWILREKLRLPPYTPVTRETLEEYGRDYITFVRLSTGLYLMDFSRGQ